MNALTDTPARTIDYTLAHWVRLRSGSDLVARAAFAASVAEGQGHACAVLEETPAQIEVEGSFADLLQGGPSPGIDRASEGSVEDAPAAGAFSTPEIERLRNHPWIGAGAAFTPFVLDRRNRCYTWRSWRHETRLAAGILERSAARVLPIATAQLAASVDALFEGTDRSLTLWQRAAVAAVPGTRFFVLTGGPGTGKTTTVLRMLLILLRHAAECGLPTTPSIALAAPTGKAAQRLAQTIGRGKEALLETLGVDSEFRPLLALIPHGDARTLHRLLGFRPRENTFAHAAGDPLAADIVVVDEASMADLATMRQLVDALRPNALLILLGDPDQLASVDAGCVLADIVACAPCNRFPELLVQRIGPLLAVAPERANEDAALAGQVVTLTHVWRAGSGLQSAIEALRRNETAWLDEFLVRRDVQGLRLHACANSAALRGRVDAWMGAHAASLTRLMSRSIAPEAALELLRDSQVLCALREGPFGARGLNALFTRRLVASSGFDVARTWYHGRPVIIVRNDYSRGLFNGDVGVALEGADGMRVWFEVSDRQGAFGLRSFSPRALPEHETAWAITIHRSQGSEYADVAVVLPPEADNPILSRELIYTAVSRARRSAEIWADDEALRNALARTVQRQGGLRERLSHG